MMKKKSRVMLWVAAVLLICGSAWAAGPPPWLNSARQAIGASMSEIGAAPGERNLLVLTNAGYGSIESQSTEAFLDAAQQVTGCSSGTRSLLALHSSLQEPLWWALYRKDTGKLVFTKWTGKDFERQAIDAAPAAILTPEAWKQAASGLIGQKLFSVASIAVTWAVDPPWTLLQAACFHDHFCPGVNSGYIAGLYLMEQLPLAQGDQYVFVVSPGKCAADALQVMFNTTPGKSSGFATAISDASLEKYARAGVPPSIVAMRVNKKADACTGKVLGFDWKKAYADTGVKAEEMAPPGGPGNPLFWVARAKMSRELARFPKEKLLAYIVELKPFSGKASLADQVAGADPYAVVWNQ